MPHRVLSNVKAKEVEPWWAVVRLQGMRDPRLTGLQRQAQRAEPLGDEVVAMLDHGEVLMEDYQVVSIDHHIGRWSVLAVVEGLCDGRFEAVESDIGQQG